MKSLMTLPIYKGIAYRAETGYDNNGKTAYDVVKFEIVTLGNKGLCPNLKSSMLSDLKRIPAHKIIWITKTKADCEHYGVPEKISLSKQARIVGEDGDGGYLVLNI